MPFAFLFITLGDYKVVFLEYVTGPSLFADNVCAVVSFYKLIDYLQFCLIETAEDLDGIVNYFHCYSACCLVFLEVRTGIKVELLQDGEHVHLGGAVQDSGETYVARFICGVR